MLDEAGARPDEAEALAARAAARPGPDRYRAQDTLGRIQLRRGRCQDAERAFREALATESLPDGARARLQQGLASATACEGR